MTDLVPINPTDPEWRRTHFHEDRSPSLIGLNVMLIVLTTAAVVLRLWARKLFKSRWMRDDLLILVALGLAWGACIIVILRKCCPAIMIRVRALTVIAELHYGLGKHTFRVGARDLVKLLKLRYGGTLFFICCLAVSRLSVLALYVRLFSTRRFRLVNLAVAVFVVMQALAFFFLFAFQCRPVRRIWHLGMGGVCLRTGTLYMTQASLSVPTDFLILLLPLPMVWRLQVTLRRKWALTCVFIIGGGACVAAVVRLHFVRVVFGQPNFDFLWHTANLQVWSNVEPCIGIITACLPVIGPLFRVYFKKRLTRASRSRSTSNHRSTTTPRTGVTDTADRTVRAGSIELNTALRAPESTYQPNFASRVTTSRDSISLDDCERLSVDGIQVKSEVEWSTEYK